MNIGIILAAGTSSRFLINNHCKVQKQLHILNGKAIVAHSTEVFCKSVDKTIVVTNSDCYLQIKKTFKKHDIDVIKNDINCRITSIKTAINHIGNSTVSNIIIHDAARPFITKKHIKILLDSSKNYLCSQFYFKLVNGLIKVNENDVEIADRNQYIELVTPQIIDYRLARDLFQNYIDLKSCEIIPILNTLKIKYNLIEASQIHLRKITTMSDIQQSSHGGLLYS